MIDDMNAACIARRARLARDRRHTFFACAATAIVFLAIIGLVMGWWP